ncbi:MAG: hypothetical protein QN122_11140 [Armatimonadota bacterium]|nr:hypothetical protein [Armatimonadota bacterium]MDR7447596.1 hypothetical protein [Armatimonadota bacterium]MDR7459523.1 hypothetical protein [Armatimonadota bacterium]MDR7480501.1 hypothetical protein [Armatimonadota bacterium]MDR7489095.1 hypothetical protein [Armatimonadota bacterium]
MTLALPDAPLLPPPARGLILVRGPDACLTVGLLLALRTVGEDRTLLVVDGANAFDPYLVGHLARRLHRSSRWFLERIRVSRAFTAYQLEALLKEHLPRIAAAGGPSALFLSGPLDALLDENLHRSEAVRVFRRVLDALDRLLALPWTVVAACPDLATPPGREWFLGRLEERAVRRVRVTVGEEGWRIREEGSGREALWQPAIPVLHARRWW